MKKRIIKHVKRYLDVYCVTYFTEDGVQQDTLFYSRQKAQTYLNKLLKEEKENG